ncbi:hypothetical protein FRB91_003916 [Serendipita sp. 411]|nr:hypothetical protein FRB91_003916 [Serendipita sp. 411]
MLVLLFRSRDEDTVLEPKSHSNKLSKTASQSNEASELPPSKESSSPVSSTPQTGPPGNYCDSNGPSFESREDSPFGQPTRRNQNQNTGNVLSSNPSQNEQALTTHICGASLGNNVENGLKSTTMPVLDIPQSTRMDIGNPSPGIESPVEGVASSRRSSRYASGTNSQRNSQLQSLERSKHGSLSSLRSHRPAPPSPMSSHSSRNNSQALIPSQIRRESVDSQVSSNSTERFPSPKPSTGSLRKSFTNSSTSGALSISSSRRQSSLAISFTNPYLEGSGNLPLLADTKPLVASPVRSENPVCTSEADPIISPKTYTPGVVPMGPIFAVNNDHMRRNFSSTSASTSGSSSSVPSNPGLKHANELAAAYASMGINIYSPMPGTSVDSVVDQQQELDSSDPQRTDDVELEWHRSHPIVVRDYAYNADDERFSRTPVELMLRCDRPQPLQNTRRTSQSRFMTGSGSSYTSGAHYGGRWDADDDEEEVEDDDDWGFPLGSISGAGGIQAPMGSTRSGPSSQLKNRTRGWNNLGSKSLGGRWVNVSEEESSGFYDESGEEDGFGEIGVVRRHHGDDEDGDEYYGEDVQTPSRTYLHSPLRDVFPHPEVEDHHGIDGDDDHSPYSTGEDDDDYARTVPLKSGVYRALYPFEAEGPSEVSLAKDQLVRVLGRHGDGWALVLRNWTVELAIKGRRESLEGGPGQSGEEAQGLVPESYLVVYQLDDEPSSTSG